MYISCHFESLIVSYPTISSHFVIQVDLRPKSQYPYMFPPIRHTMYTSVITDIPMPKPGKPGKYHPFPGIPKISREIIYSLLIAIHTYTRSSLNLINYCSIIIY